MPELTMPKMGDSMEEGTIVRWLKREGDEIAEGEPIAEIQTEKANIEIQAYQAGTLTRIIVQEGETVPVNAPIAVLDGDGQTNEAVPASAPEGSGKEAAPAEAAQSNGGGSPAKAPEGREEGSAPPQPVGEEGAARTPGQEPAPQQGATARSSQGGPPLDLTIPGGPVGTGQAPRAERVKASPLARKVAAEHGVDLAQLQGSGPAGRIVEADVSGFMNRGAPAPARAPEAPQPPAAQPAQAPPPQPVAPRPVTIQASERTLSPMRKVIARRLSESKQTIPHFYVTTDVDAAPFVRMRSELNAARGDTEKLAVDAFIVKACALALARFPQVNSQLDGDTLRTLASINVGVAVSLPDGLIVPVVRDCQGKSLSRISGEIRELAGRAREGKMKPDDYTGGTFTISNLGMYDVEHFAAVINPPEAAILAIGSVRDEAVVKDGAVVPGKRMRVTLSADHRVVDGALAAQFLQEVKRLLQTPLSLLE